MVENIPTNIASNIHTSSPISTRISTTQVDDLQKEVINLTIIQACQDNLFNHLCTSAYIKNLIYLYQISQIECSRNKKLTQEVGSSRERDFIAIASSNPSLSVVYDLPNKDEEDVVINSQALSIKHSSNKANTQNGIKIKWTVEAEKRKEFLENFVFNNDIIIIYVRFNDTKTCGTIEIIYITKETMQNEHLLFKSQNQKTFKCLDGNSRGIEFETKYFNSIKNKTKFHIKISFNNFKCLICDPIQRRLKLLEIYGQ